MIETDRLIAAAPASPQENGATAFGGIAERLARQALGSLWRFQGFLATPGNGKHPVLHIQDFQQDF